jgi:hypothetical protein
MWPDPNLETYALTAVTVKGAWEEPVASSLTIMRLVLSP